MNTEQLLAGRYRIIDKVGAGGMAIVYRAEDTNTGRSVAIKILKTEYSEDEEFSKRFEREADAISQMSHHNIVNLLDVGSEDGAPYIVMEYVQGKTLKVLIKEKGKMAPDVAAQVAIRILAALQHAHQNGIIHRDIKPQNILVHEDGHIKVADFGIATKMDSETLTKNDNVMGTVHYISPEQASGKEVGVTSDLYSVGVVLYEMLTGRVPYDGDTVVAVAMQHLRGAYTPIGKLVSGVPQGLVHVVDKAMAKKPQERYQSAYEMASDIRLALKGETFSTIEPPAPDVQDKKGSSGRIKPVTQIVTQQAAHVKRKPSQGSRQRLKQLVQLTMILVVTALVMAGLVFGVMTIYNNIVNKVTPPALEGMQVDAAVRAAEHEGLKAELIHVHHATTMGVVIKQTPTYNPDARMHRGDTIVLTVSKGPNMVNVPNLKGQLSVNAQSSLQSIGVGLTVTERVVSSEPVDTILSQIPEENTMLTIGEMVRVTVSGGATVVPNAIGMTVEQAAAALDKVGLVGEVNEWLATTHAQDIGRIAAQKPAADAQVIQGAVVRLSVYNLLRYNGNLAVPLPANTEGLQVKVTYVRPNGEEEEQYSAIHPSSEEETTFEADVFADEQGEATYKLYINGEYRMDLKSVIE